MALEKIGEIFLQNENRLFKMKRLKERVGRMTCKNVKAGIRKAIKKVK
jgi:hypothetical protein